MNKLFLLSLLAGTLLLAIGCTPSESAIQTALAQTQTAYSYEIVQ